jgi:hypothetical protein
MTEATRIRLGEPEAQKPPSGSIQLVQSSGSADPKIALAIFEDRYNIIGAQAALILCIVPVVDETASTRIKAVETAQCCNPQCTPGLLIDEANIIVA